MAREIAFIDPSVPDLETLLGGLRPDLDAVLLSPYASAPCQIAQVLRGCCDLDAVHIIAHGEPGKIGFTGCALTLDALEGHASDLAAIGNALTPDGELLLWSCETGKGNTGKAFLAALERISNASIAAATHPIGSVAKGGSWTLDAGLNASSLAPLTASACTVYSGLLVITVDLNTGTGGNDDTSTYTENSGNTTLFGSANVSADFLNWVTDIWITLSGWNGTEALGVTVGSGLTVDLTSATVGGNYQLHIHKSGSDNPFTEVWTAALNTLVYQDASNQTPSGSRNVTIQVSQENVFGPNGSATQTETINIASVNDAPTANIIPASFSATEQTSLNLKGQFSTITDVDALGGVLTATLVPSNGIINATAGNSGVNLSGAGTGLLTVSGTLTQLNAFFGAASTSTLSYINNLNAPPSSVSLSFQVNDNGNSGGAFALGTDTATINITGVNDAPTLVTNTGITLFEGSYAYILWNNLSTADPDTSNQNITYTITSLPSNGILYKNGVALGLNGTFTQDDINGRFVAYVHNGTSTPTTVSFGFSVSDGIAAPIAGQTFNFTITPVNDPPTLITNTGIPLNEGESATIKTAQLEIYDPDDPATGITYHVDSGDSALTHGTLFLNGVALSVGDTFTQADINNELITYTHDGSETTSDSFVFHISESSADVTISGQTFTFTIVPVNDTPAVNFNTGLTLDEGASATITSTQLDFNDPDNPDTSITYTITSVASNGTLFKNGVALVLNSTFTQADINNNLVTYTHDGSDTTGAFFGFSVSDGVGGLNPDQSFHFTINPVNDPPSAGSDIFEGGPAPENISGLDGDDVLSGGGGNDVLIGGLGKDFLTGGADADVFDFNLKTESRKGILKRDVILDFSGVGGELDHIDLSDIDANSHKRGNQDFKFIDAHKFHHRAGELQVKYDAANQIAIVQGDIDGNGKADFQIEVYTSTKLFRDDFVGVVQPAIHQAAHQPAPDFGWLWERGG